ncbi:MAG: hypothetical protein D6683_13920, partial [Actinomyces sp.]
MPDDDTATPLRPPLDRLNVLAKVDADLGPAERMVEIYTLEGLLSIWWFGEPGAGDLAIMLGGAAGGYLGPARALYPRLGRWLATQGRAAMIVDYRRPGDLDRCLLDAAAAADLAVRNGAERFCFLGHSFGGAVAVSAGAVLRDHTAGVVGLASQSAGCEGAAELGDTPLLLIHGARDRILPVESSAMISMIAGHGDLRVFADADHLLDEAAAEIEA